jgi:hypothetical protein
MQTTSTEFSLPSKRGISVSKGAGIEKKSLFVMLLPQNLRKGGRAIDIYPPEPHASSLEVPVDLLK